MREEELVLVRELVRELEAVPVRDTDAVLVEEPETVRENDSVSVLVAVAVLEGE